MKIKTITLLFFIGVSSLFSQNPVVPNSPGKVFSSTVTCPNRKFCQGADWYNQSNAKTEDGLFAADSLSPVSTPYFGFSRQLFATKYGFNIAGSSTILGISVGVKRMSSLVSSLNDSIVSLTKDGSTAVGSNEASSSYWGTTNAYAYYGGSTDLWGTTWTVAEINDSTFGVDLLVKNISANSPTASLDVITVTVFYSPVTGIVESQTRSISSFSVYTNPTKNTLETSFGLSKNTDVKISVYNMIGQIQFIKSMGTLAEGNYTESIEMPYLTSGIYFVKLSLGDEDVTRKFMVSH